MKKFIKIDNVGEVGYISAQDKKDYELPPNAWSNVTNIRFDNKSAMSTASGKCVTKPTYNSADPDYYSEAIGVNRASGKFWMIFGNNDIKTIKPAESCDTPPTENVVYTTTNTVYPSDIWMVDIIYGNVIATNGKDIPVYHDSSYDNTQNMQNLPGWETYFGASSWCKAITSYKGFIIVGNIFSNDHSPTRIAWSDSFQDISGTGGQIPTEWDPAATNSLAGSIWLPTGVGEIIAMKRLRDDVIIYCTNGIYRMSYVGGDKIFEVREIFNDTGLYGPHCVATYDGYHVFLSNNDIFHFDGQQLNTIADSHVRSLIYGSINKDLANRIEVTAVHDKSEIAFSYPANSITTVGVDTMLIWNWNEGTWSKRELEKPYNENRNTYTTIIRELFIIDQETNNINALTWDEVTDTWDSVDPDAQWGGITQSTGDLDIYGIGHIGEVSIPYYTTVVDELRPDVAFYLDDINLTQSSDLGKYQDKIPLWQLPSNVITNITGREPILSEKGGKCIEFNGNDPDILDKTLMDYDSGNNVTIQYTMQFKTGAWGLGIPMGLLSLDVIRYDYTKTHTLYQFYVEPGSSDGLWNVFTQDVYMDVNDGKVYTENKNVILTDVDLGTTDSFLVTYNIDGDTNSIKINIDGKSAVINNIEYTIRKIRAPIYCIDMDANGDYIHQLDETRVDHVIIWHRNLEQYEVDRLYNSFENTGQVIPEYDVIYRFDKSYKRISGEVSTSILERTGLILDPESNTVVVSKVIPRIESSGDVHIYIGSADKTEGDYTWHGPYKYNPSIDNYKIDCMIRGRYHGIKLLSYGSYFKLSGYDIEYISGGRK